MFMVRISHINNPKRKFTVVARHMVGSATGSVQLVKQFSTEVLVNFANTAELNKFLRDGNTEYKVEKVDRPKVYFCQQVIQIWDGSQFWCQATIWPEGDPTNLKKFIGPKKDGSEEARKAFWYLWNHGNHEFKTEEGMSARLTRFKSGYEEVCV
jgi:hypothetical protein